MSSVSTRPQLFRQPSSRRSSFSSIASTSSWAVEATGDADERASIAPRLYRTSSSSSSVTRDKDSLRLRIALDLARSGYVRLRSPSIRADRAQLEQEIDSPLGSPGFDADRTPRRGFIAPAPRVRQLSGESSSILSSSGRKRSIPSLLDIHTATSLSPPPPSPEASFLDLSKAGSPLPKTQTAPARQRALEDVAAGALRALQMREVEPSEEETQTEPDDEEPQTPDT